MNKRRRFKAKRRRRYNLLFSIFNEQQVWYFANAEASRKWSNRWWNAVLEQDTHPRPPRNSL